jgi:N-carbamoyl-L-amino-acid hydrolase
LTTAAEFRACFAPLAAIGRNPATGGYNRFAWTDEDRAARDWFTQEAGRRGASDVETDRNGNVWAWFGDPSAMGAVATGSHLDTVPEAGAYDGALGVAGGLLAAEAVCSRPNAGARRPLAVVAFADEEGARFGVACVGSKLLSGALDPADARGLRDAEGVTLAEAVRPFDVDPDRLGADTERLTRLAAYVELHVEQGRRLDIDELAVAAAGAIWPHGRWRLTIPGVADHAGTTRLEDRRDPMLPLAAVIEEARNAAAQSGGLATIGRLAVTPNGTNVIPSSVTAWLDVRAPDDGTVDTVVAAVARAAGRDATLALESRSPAVTFDAGLRDSLGLDAVIATGAGHDAGVLASVLPTAMIFVRNPSGVSHSPAEHATDEDCATGIDALATALDRLTAT